MKKIKKITLVGHDVSGSKMLFDSITQAFPDVEFSIIITSGLYYKKNFFESVVKLLKESSVLFCAARAADLFLFKLRGNTIKNHCKKEGTIKIETRDVNSVEVVDFIEKFSPDLIVSLYTMQIFKQQILSIPRFGGITSHPSILPNYRGLEVFFWAMVNEEDCTGVSVFYLDTKIDSGRVIQQEVVPIESGFSMQNLYVLVTEVAARLLIVAIENIDDDDVNVTIPEGEGTYYPMPTRTAVWKFLRLGKRFF